MRRLGSMVVAAGVALVFASSASAASFDARGSAEQVDVTGRPNALVSSSTPPTRSSSRGTPTPAAVRSSATSAPVAALRFESRRGETSGPLTVTQDPIKAGTSAAPDDPSIYNQTLLTHGYGYMTMRDGTKLAYDVHPPTDVANSLPLPSALANAIAAAAPPLGTLNRRPPWSSTPATATRTRPARSAAFRRSPT